MKNQKLTLGYSPCPNDTFIFDAMVHQKIDTEGLEFEVYLADVEELNQKAFQSKLDITKLSYHAFAYVLNNYQLLNSGSALGENCGPLLITTKRLKNKFNPQNVNQAIAIPGKFTTANFLFSIAYPQLKNKIEMVFSEIEQAVLDEKVDAGLIIHENRFTYKEKGLEKICDLGQYWEETTKNPIPLGGIAVKRNLDLDLKLKVDRVLKRSVKYALDNPKESSNYVAQNAQEMDAEITKQHIDLYVNQFSMNLGKKGKKAVEILLKKAEKLEIIPFINQDIFVN